MIGRFVGEMNADKSIDPISGLEVNVGNSSDEYYILSAILRISGVRFLNTDDTSSKDGGLYFNSKASIFLTLNISILLLIKLLGHKMEYLEKVAVDFCHWLSVLKKAEHCLKMRWIPLWWAHLGSNQGPTDYESATLTN